MDFGVHVSIPRCVMVKWGLQNKNTSVDEFKFNGPLKKNKKIGWQTVLMKLVFHEQRGQRRYNPVDRVQRQLQVVYRVSFSSKFLQPDLPGLYWQFPSAAEAAYLNLNNHESFGRSREISITSMSVTDVGDQMRLRQV